MTDKDITTFNIGKDLIRATNVQAAQTGLPRSKFVRYALTLWVRGVIGFDENVPEDIDHEFKTNIDDVRLWVREI